MAAEIDLLRIRAEGASAIVENQFDIQDPDEIYTESLIAKDFRYVRSASLGKRDRPKIVK